MRNIATCYSDHAVKVSDSYCSGPFHKSYVSPKSIPAVQTAVSQTFKAKFNGHDPLFAAVTWCSKLICQGFFLHVSRKNLLPNGPHHRYQFAKPKGNKRVEFEGNGLVVHWDLSSARFESSGPEPVGSFYIVILVPDCETAVVLGDMESDPDVRNLVNEYKIRTHTLVSQHEHHSSHWSNPITTRVRFDGSRSDHEVIVNCGPDDDGPRNPVLSISVDKKKVVRVKRLQWNFRGNQVIFVDGLLIDVMWDVFGWFFENQRGINNKNNNCGLFMFRVRSGLDCRLWLEEDDKKSGQNQDEFALLISVNSKNPS